MLAWHISLYLFTQYMSLFVMYYIHISVIYAWYTYILILYIIYICTSLCLKWVSWGWHIAGSCFLIHSEGLCLLFGMFRPLIIDIAVFYLFLSSTLFLPFVVLIELFIWVHLSPSLVYQIYLFCYFWRASSSVLNVHLQLL